MQKPWSTQTLATFDLETTSPDPHEAKIVTYGLAIVNADGTALTRETAIVRPEGFVIPDEAADVHGVTTEIAERDGIQLDTVLARLRLWFERLVEQRIPLVVYNAPYDLTVLAHAFGEHYGQLHVGLIDEQVVIDPLVIDKHWDKYRKGSRRLADVAAHYGVTLGDAHDSLADALAAERLARVQLKRYGLGGDPPLLHRYQAGWYRAKAANFEHYLRTKKGEKDASINREWPRQKLANEPEAVGGTPPQAQVS
jgi:DNA polymerase-3 subunit epsilon